MTDDIRAEITEIQDQSSMDYWWPILSRIDVPTPDTIRLEITDEQEFQDGLTLPVPNEDELREAIHAVDGPPAFLRSDVTSSKHGMKGGSMVESDENPISNVAGIVEEHHLSMGMPMPSSFYVREWLDLWHLFKTFRDSATPIAAEVRVFLLDGEWHDSAFYWPEDAIWGHSATEEGWPALHEQTKERAGEDLGVIRDHAERVATVFTDDYWSVDFALTDDGDWYAIDMARGEMSFHPPGATRAVSDPRERKFNE